MMVDSNDVLKHVREKKITVFMGKSAAGKDYFFKKALKAGLNVKPLIKYTTRPIREGEENGVTYHFVTRDEFKKLEAKNIFDTVQSFDTTVKGIHDTWYYGSPKIDFNEDWVAICTPTEAVELSKIHGADKMEVLFLSASDDIRTERAKNRGSFDKSEWERRLKADAEDFSDKNIETLRGIFGDNFIIFDNN